MTEEEIANAIDGAGGKESSTIREVSEVVICHHYMPSEAWPCAL